MRRRVMLDRDRKAFTVPADPVLLTKEVERDCIQCRALRANEPRETREEAARAEEDPN